jgi:hypothetical protein
MKTFLTFVISSGVVLYFSGISTYAQSKGQGNAQVPSGNQGHSQSSAQGKTKSDEHGAHASAANDHGPKAEVWQTKINERFQSDAKFRARMESLLPPGMDLKTAESGFKNHGQFIAALHVSKNLGISFDQLKAKMTGVTVDAKGQTTSSTPASLGKAIHELRPNMPETQANKEAQRAEKQAEETEKPKPIS